MPSIEKSTISLASLAGILSLTVAGSFGFANVYYMSNQNRNDIKNLEAEIVENLKEIKSYVRKNDNNIRTLERDITSISRTIELLVDTKKADLNLNR